MRQKHTFPDKYPCDANATWSGTRLGEVQHCNTETCHFLLKLSFLGFLGHHFPAGPPLTLEKPRAGIHTESHKAYVYNVKFIDTTNHLLGAPH